MITIDRVVTFTKSQVMINEFSENVEGLWIRPLHERESTY